MIKYIVLPFAAGMLLIPGCGGKGQTKLDISIQQDSPKVDVKVSTDDMSADVSTDPNSSPEAAVKTIIEAGKSGNYEKLGLLCHPEISSDGDVKDICKLGEKGTQRNREFDDYFGNATIVGAAEIDGNRAKVHIQTTAEGGEKETIGLERLGDKWYLVGF